MRGMIRTVSVSLLLLVGPGASAADREIAWETESAAALRAAASTRRPIFVDVWAVWCVPCKQLDVTTYRDESVLDAVTAFVPLKIDFDLQTSFVSKYGVGPLPTLLFLDHEGKELLRHEGVVSASLLLSLFQRVSVGYADFSAGIGDSPTPTQVESAAIYLERLGAVSRARTLRKRLKPQR